MNPAARPPGAPERPRRGLLSRLLRRATTDGVDGSADDGGLVVARAFDAERGDAAVLDELTAEGRDLSKPVRLRHVFRVLDGADVSDLRGGLTADGYQVALEGNVLTASASVLLTPLSTAQARARMTGLTTRHPVDYLGWEALAPGG